MKAHTEYLTLTVPGKMTFVNITPKVEEAIRKSGVREGIVLINTRHRCGLVDPAVSGAAEGAETP